MGLYFNLETRGSDDESDYEFIDIRHRRGIRNIMKYILWGFIVRLFIRKHNEG